MTPSKPLAILIRLLAPLAATAALVAQAPAQAAMVTNGGFESGDFSGWSKLGLDGSASVSSTSPHSGLYTARFSHAAAAGIEQVLATEAGATYDVSFWFEVSGPADNDFAFNWDGGAAEYVVADSNPGFATLHFVLTASSGVTPLDFLFRTNDGRWRLDDVVVDRHDGGTVPVPATWALAACGLLGLGASRRRSR